METRVLARGGGGSESSDEEYKAEAAFALLFLINDRSDRALVFFFCFFWCVFPAFLKI